MENLYLIKCNEHFKIGITNDLTARVAALQTGNPYLLTVVACFQFPNAGVMEKALHQRFAGVRKLGEWFTLGESDVNDFMTACEILGGIVPEVRSELVSQDELENAEDIQEAVLSQGKTWDFSQMFRDGWRMELANDGERHRYWCWRRGNGGGREYIYGGAISELPLHDLSEMRRVFRDGKLYQPYLKEVVE